MTTTEAKKRILLELNSLPQKSVREVFDFIEFLKLREDQWFIDFINRRTKAALEDKKKGKRFFSLKEIQKAYK
jgi:hypothetical protein